MKLTLLKLGGSLVTVKDKPLTANNKAISVVARMLAKAQLPSDNERLLIVHGGGSFGHYYAKKFQLTTKRISNINPSAVALTSMAMQKLHSLILEALVSKGLPCKTIDASELLEDDLRRGISNSAKQKLAGYFSQGIIPMSFGNVDVAEKGVRIISGDELCLRLANAFPVQKMVFAMDVDGIFTNSSLKGKPMHLLKESTIFSSKNRKLDVTGGIASKIRTGFDLAKLGADVFFLNGGKGRRLLDCLLGVNLESVGTRIEAYKAVH